MEHYHFLPGIMKQRDYSYIHNEIPLHEAAHAVASFCLGHRVRRVRGGRYDGVCMVHMYGENYIHQIAIALAPKAYFSNQSQNTFNECHFDDDMRKASKTARKYNKSQTKIFNQTVRLMKKQSVRRATRLLAKVIRTRRYVSGAVVDRVLRHDASLSAKRSMVA